MFALLLTTECSVNPGDITWVLLACILVLCMMPALALFEGGLLRSKNTLSLAMQIVGGLSVLNFFWIMIGYSFVFGDDVLGGFIANPFTHILLRGVSYEECDPRLAPNIPNGAYVLFQSMFACITPLLMTGAYAERMKFKASLVISILFEVLVYYPVAHWIWGGGWLDRSNFQALDFAGGIVIHTTAGVGSLVLAKMIGPRIDFEKYHGEFPPSNIPLALVGFLLLWMSWFGFNGGSALSAGQTAVSTVMSTQIAATVSGVVWLFLSWIRGRPSLVALINGIIAGLAGVTPASGFIGNPASIVLGFLLGFGSYFGVILFKHKLHIDDALDVSSVHGLTGIIGSIYIGFACDSSLSTATLNVPDGVIFGQSKQLGIQVVAVCVAAAWAGAMTFLIAKFVDRFIGLRITADEEKQGLDIVEHGEFSYHNLVLFGVERFEVEKAQYEAEQYASPGHSHDMNVKLNVQEDVHHSAPVVHRIPVKFNSDMLERLAQDDDS